MLFIQIEARAARLHLATDRGRYAAPGAFNFGEIFGDRADRPILLDQLRDDVIERLESRLMDADVPVAVRHDVVAGAGLRFGGRSQLVLLALGRYVVDVDFDFVLLSPLCADFI